MINLDKYHSGLVIPSQLKNQDHVLPEIEDPLSYKNESNIISSKQNVVPNPDTQLDSNTKIADSNGYEKERKGSDCSNFQFSSFRTHSFSSILGENNIITDKYLVNTNNEEAVRKIVEKSINHKKHAAKLFKKNKYAEAAVEFQKAIDMLNIDETFSNIINTSNFILNKIECMTNIAFCFYQMKKFEETIAITNNVFFLLKKVLKIQNNVRALYFRAKALKNLNRIEEAYEDIKFALTIKSNQSLIKELNELHEKMEIKQTKNTFQQKSPISFTVEIETPKKKDKLNDEFSNEELKIPVESNSNIVIKLFKILLHKLIEFIKRNKTISTGIIIIILYMLKNRARFNSSDLIKVFTLNINSE